MKELLSFIHPVLGMLGVFFAIWIFVEIINAGESNIRRIKFASLAIPIFIVLTWITAGILYVLYYAADKAIILAGPWSFAHAIVMETKEHIFFITLLLSLLIPFVVWSKNFLTNRNVRVLSQWIAALIILSGLALEAAGAIISMGIRMGLVK